MSDPSGYTYISTQSTKCAGCGIQKHTPLRNDEMGGYVCLTCIDKKLERLQRELASCEADKARLIEVLQKSYARRPTAITKECPWLVVLSMFNSEHDVFRAALAQSQQKQKDGE